LLWIAVYSINKKTDSWNTHFFWKNNSCGRMIPDFISKKVWKAFTFNRWRNMVFICL
jgi:hypothetical protein